MSIRAFRNLKDVREGLVGYQLPVVVRLTGISTNRMLELESGKDDPTVWEVEQLSRIYGVEPDVLAEHPIRVAPSDVVHTLTSVDEFHGISDLTRASVVAAARAVRDIASLRALLGELVPEVPRINVDVGTVPWQDGLAAAVEARKMWDLGEDAILSMRDLVRDVLPEVPVLYASLGESGPAGLTFAGSAFAPAIVLNLDGRNLNACVRRFSLAHELYHLLCDWNRGETLATLSGYLEDRTLEREQRANSFAIRFLCPQSKLEELRWDMDAIDVAKVLIAKWGLHYSAAALYTWNVRRQELPKQMPTPLLAKGLDALWDDHEAPMGIDRFPIVAVPPERRTIVARLAARAYARRLIQRDRFAEYLDVPPTEPIESVSLFLGVDLPPTDSVEAA